MSLNKTDKILDHHQIIKGVKPVKQKPKYGDKEFVFNKEIPLGPMNYPISKYTDWDIYGYKIDKLTGIKRPHWMTKRLPTGQQLNPQKCGLDGFFNIKAKNQVI